MRHRCYGLQKVSLSHSHSSLVLRPISITPLLDTHGSIYPLAVALEPIPISMLDLVWRGARVQGSLVASRDTICSLIEFAARKNITPTVVTYPLTLEGVEKAMQDLRNGKVRYRAVLCRD
jgi:D-arabinose 1-dehydrogenase-like Zn-dependent alcohol dehydrogenase